MHRHKTAGARLSSVFIADRKYLIIICTAHTLALYQTAKIRCELPVSVLTHNVIIHNWREGFAMVFTAATETSSSE